MIIAFSRGLRGVFVAVMLFIGPFSAAQSRIPISVKTGYDPGSIPEIMNTIPVGFTFKFSGNQELSTRGFLNGRIRWSSLEISSQQGTIYNGQFTFDRGKVWDNNHQAAFKIKIDGRTVSCNLSLPYAEHIRFNLYTDSLKRGEPFYLNVEGEFSSGRIYPLDTGMIALRKSGGGELAGQSILVGHQDTSVHIVKVYAWLKTDSEIRDSVLIPVKILPNPANLPTEQ